MTNVKIAPSILAADFADMGADVRMIAEAGADIIHCDIMDGHFVPNMSFGPDLVKAIRPHTTLEMDVHLMVSNPGDWIEPFARAGANIITFHVEAERHIQRQLACIRALGVKAGLVLNPATPLTPLEYVLPYCDMVLLMSVNPGFGGQSFIPETLEKIRALRRMIEERDLRVDIEVDGGINKETGRACIQAGATVLVAGSHVFAAPDKQECIRALRGQ